MVLWDHGKFRVAVGGVWGEGDRARRGETLCASRVWKGEGEPLLLPGAAFLFGGEEECPIWSIHSSER